MKALITYFSAAVIAYSFMAFGEFCKRKFPNWGFSKWFNQHIIHDKTP
jgi:hypothetical protein